MRVHRYVSVAGIRKSKTGGGECKPLYFSLINIDSTEGNSILLYAVKNTTWINFTISHFSVLIKKQQSPLKKSIPAKEAKRENSPAVLPSLSSVNSKTCMEMLLGLFFCIHTVQHSNRTFQSWKCWLGLLFFCISLRSDCVEERAETRGGMEEWEAIVDVELYVVSALNRLSGCPWTILHGQHNLKFRSGSKLNEHYVSGTSSISAHARFSCHKMRPRFFHSTHRTPFYMCTHCKDCLFF